MRLTLSGTIYLVRVTDVCISEGRGPAHFEGHVAMGDLILVNPAAAEGDIVMPEPLIAASMSRGTRATVPSSR